MEVTLVFKTSLTAVSQYSPRWTSCSLSVWSLSSCPLSFRLFPSRSLNVELLGGRKKSDLLCRAVSENTKHPHGSEGFKSLRQDLQHSHHPVGSKVSFLHQGVKRGLFPVQESSHSNSLILALGIQQGSQNWRQPPRCAEN